MDYAQTTQWLRNAAALLHDSRDRLTELDKEIGDADHGINMDRGFNAVLAKLPAAEESDIGTILKTVGMALVGSVGGAGGPLYGTLFMRMGTAVANKTTLSDEDVVAMLDAGVKGVVERGKANLGDKTMIDALQPAVDALRRGVAENKGVVAALAGAKAAAQKADTVIRESIRMLHGL